GATLINTARGALVDTGALVAELGTRRIRAVVDVTDPEPLPDDHPLWTTPGVMLTPHVAGALGNELTRLGSHAVDEIVRLLTAGSLATEVHATQAAEIAWAIFASPALVWHTPLESAYPPRTQGSIVSRNTSAVRDIGFIMTGASGRMGYRQHLVRSILAIRDEGG